MIDVFTQTVVVADPPINVIVELGLIVIVPVVVAVTQIPEVAMVYVKVPDCVAVPLMVNSFVASLYPDVNPAGKTPVIVIPLVLDVDLYTMGVIVLFIQIVVVADPLCNAIVAFGLIVMVPVVVALAQSPYAIMVYVNVPD